MRLAHHTFPAVDLYADQCHPSSRQVPHRLAFQHLRDDLPLDFLTWPARVFSAEDEHSARIATLSLLAGIPELFPSLGELYPGSHNLFLVGCGFLHVFP